MNIKPKYKTKKSERWDAIIQDYLISDMNLKSYCSSHQIKQCTMEYWLNKPKKCQGLVKPEFAEVKIQTTQLLVNTLRIRLPGGTEIQTSGCLSDLKEILAWHGVLPC